MRGFVYSIRSNLTPKIYIGSTCSPLSVRMAGHRQNFKKFKAGKYNNVTSFEILEFGDAYIECIEVVEFTEKVELTAREGYFQRTMVCVNRKIEGRTGVQYRADNIEKILEYGKQHYAANTEKILGQQKQHYLANTEAILEKNKNYRAANAAAINAQKSEKITCECGKTHRRGAIASHRRTAKHIKALAALTPLIV